IPYLYIRLPGIRDDEPHLNAFAGALALLAPYPRTLESTKTPEWISQKTLYLDFINTQQKNAQTYQDFIKHLIQLITDEKALSSLLDDKNTSTTVTVIKGYGGHQAIDAKLPELRQLLPYAFIISLGPIDEDKRHYVDIAAEVSDVTPFLEHSDYLLMACGLNAVAQAYDYATPLVVLPDDRPHQEQEVMAEALITQGRALSWQQFKALMTASVTHELSGEIANQSARTKSLSKPDNAKLKQKSVQTAQAFMQSMAEYPTTKAWFEQWLLPQLALKPER
ncbi:hypothetical protein, partial [Psychrobacter sp.]|uniref:hypothetical protein n=1 Tax=Psychrobacter sp. TaxID=56811 RepID=UPI002FD9BFC1